MEKLQKPASLESAIQELIEELKEMTVSPHVRELRAKAVTYGRVIANWGTYAPTAPQLQAMLECVKELEEKVSNAKRGEISHVARRPQPPPLRAEIPPPGQSQPVPRARHEPPPIPPAGVAWNANVSSSSHPRSRSMTTTAPPPPIRPTTVPPVSAPRSIDPPTPALLRSRRQR